MRTKKSGRCARQFAYVLRGACKGVVSGWSYWRKIGPDGQPLPGDGDDLAVDLNDPSARYIRTRLVPEAATIELGLGQDQSLLPVVRGVIMEACDPTTCCGECFTIPFDVLADVRRAVYGTTEASWAQCDKCGIWRKLQGGAPPLDPGAPIECKDGWDVDYRTCGTPQEDLDDREHDIRIDDLYGQGAHPVQRL